jgi:hypothetical protein
MWLSIVEFAHVDQNDAEIRIGFGKIGVDRQTLADQPDGALELALLVSDEAEHMDVSAIVRMVATQPFEGSRRFIEPAGLQMHDRFGLTGRRRGLACGGGERGVGGAMDKVRLRLTGHSRSLHL